MKRGSNCVAMAWNQLKESLFRQEHLGDYSLPKFCLLEEPQPIVQFLKRCWKGLLPEYWSIGFVRSWCKMTTALCPLSLLALNIKKPKQKSLICFELFLWYVWCCSKHSTLDICLHSLHSAWKCQAQIEHLLGAGGNVHHICWTWETWACSCLQAFASSHCPKRNGGLENLGCAYSSMLRKYWPSTWTEDHPVIHMHLAYLRFRCSYNWTLPFLVGSLQKCFFPLWKKGPIGFWETNLEEWASRLTSISIATLNVLGLLHQLAWDQENMSHWNAHGQQAVIYVHLIDPHILIHCKIYCMYTVIQSHGILMFVPVFDMFKKPFAESVCHKKHGPTTDPVDLVC